jgi:hypothetical protein
MLELLEDVSMDWLRSSAEHQEERERVVINYL